MAVKFRVILLALLTVCASTAFAAPHVGIIQENLWYSHFPFFEGETVRLYTAVWNGDEHPVRGAVAFYIEEVKIGESQFRVEPGKLTEVSLAWKALSGQKQIKAQLTEAYLVVGNTEQKLEVSGETTGKRDVFVDKDTDTDGVGNREDGDDDNDGLTDANDPNPLVKETPRQYVVSDSESASQSFTLASVASTAAPVLPDWAEERLSSFAASLDIALQKVGMPLEIARQEVSKKLKAAAGERAAEVTASATSTRNKGLTLDEIKQGSGVLARTKNMVASQLASLGALDQPFNFVYYLFLSIASYIVARPLLVSGILLLILFLIARYFTRKYRGY